MAVGDGARCHRRPGGGRPRKYSEATRSLRVGVSVSAEMVSSIPELQAILDTYEEMACANPKSERYYFLKKMIDEIRALGY